MLGEGFHALINGGLFSSQPMWDITIHPHSRPSVLAGTLSFLQSMWDRSQIHPPLGPSILTDTSPCVYPLRGIARRLAHRSVSGSNTICNNPDPPLADIILFRLFLSDSPQDLKTHMLMEGFQTLINGGVLLPNQCGTWRGW